MHIAVCDDESFFRKTLSEDLYIYADKHCLNFIIYEYSDGMELLAADMSFDLIFMDSAKSKYIVFLPRILELLEVGGIVVLDDIFQGGDVAKDIMEVRRGQRTIYRGLQNLFHATLNHPDLTASLVPLGDGILMIRKNAETVTLPDPSSF